MKREILVLLLILTLLTGCKGQEKTTKTLEESPEMAQQIAEKIQQTVTVENPRSIDDFTVEKEMGLDLSDLVAYAGDVTNNQADCALVFVALCKEGTVDEVSSALEEYRESLTSTLYLEFAEKVEKAKDARIVTKGDYVALVMDGVEGSGYEAVDTALEEAFSGEEE